ncbi:hypothetical protein F4780DRAFT_551751 [Xylariomycetidae sp. FL0641]|nr:hypothetical protein F4780DRAFT_551751 [Xylariomycetidae sp. FL0641]
MAHWFSRDHLPPAYNPYNHTTYNPYYAYHTASAPDNEEHHDDNNHNHSNSNSNNNNNNNNNNGNSALAPQFTPGPVSVSTNFNGYGYGYGPIANGPTPSNNTPNFQAQTFDFTSDALRQGYGNSPVNRPPPPPLNANSFVGPALGPVPSSYTGSPGFVPMPGTPIPTVPNPYYQPSWYPQHLQPFGPYVWGQSQPVVNPSALPSFTPAPSTPSAPSNEYSGTSDPFLAGLGQDFSSPSLPAHNSSPRGPARPLPYPGSSHQVMPAPGSRTRQTRQGGGGTVVDLTKEEPNPNAPHSGIDPAMPATTRTRRAPPSTTRDENSSSPAAPRKRKPAESAQTRPRKKRGRANGQEVIQDNVFGDGDPGNANKTEQGMHESIDLSNATGVPEELLKPKKEKTKLSKFQCVICMDDVAALTVTHCGHLFCSGCLHSALHIDSMKRICPVCRTRIDPENKKGKTAKIFYHLEMKVMTANKKGKRPMG